MQKNIGQGAAWGLSSKLLRHSALLLAHIKHLLLKMTALEEGAQSHALFGLSYLSFMCRMKLSLEPARLEEAVTNMGRAAQHPTHQKCVPRSREFAVSFFSLLFSASCWVWQGGNNKQNMEWMS